MSHLAGADLEVRRHLWFGVKRLTPSGRVRFLARLCRLAPGAVGPVRVTTHTGTARETYEDVLMLSFQHGLTLGQACEELERVLRRGWV